MQRFIRRRPSRGISPSMAVALLALFVALGGTGYAASQLAPSHSASAAAAKKKSNRGPRGRRGPRGHTGPQGAKGDKGDKGTPGTPGKDGAAAVASYGGHVDSLNTTLDSVGYATPVGFSSSESSTDSFRYILAPDIPTTLRSLSVDVTNAPGTTSMRFFYIVVGAVKSNACIVFPASTNCAVLQNMTIPARARIYLESDVSTADAVFADAAFSWRAG